METAARPNETNARHSNHARDLERRVAWITVAGPFIGALAAVAGLWKRGLTPLDLGLWLGLSVITIFGITAGYHRLFTHQSFKAHPAVRWALGAAGSMAAQGPLLFWAACHRRHHQHSDGADDPHSPAHGGRGLKGALVGLWRAHIGWMFQHEPEPWGHYVPDLLRDTTAFRINNAYLVFVALGLIVPATIGGLFAGPPGALTGFLWGGLARIFLVHHITWSINSLCHLSGSQPYNTSDDSRNNALCALLALGEGWHNNHHAFPTSARHGLAWWQVDATYMLLRGLAACGLIWDVKLPAPELLISKRRTDLAGETIPVTVRHGET
jgi:stearoyl-CoA desaturase (delta-9 desaturase)